MQALRALLPPARLCALIMRIARLRSSDAELDAWLTPAKRAEFARSLADVDDIIAAFKQTGCLDPKILAFLDQFFAVFEDET